MRLTRMGRAQKKVLDGRSDALAVSLLDPLSPQEREELVAAMEAIERVMMRTSVTVCAGGSRGSRGQGVRARVFRGARSTVRHRLRPVSVDERGRRRAATTQRDARDRVAARRGRRMRCAQVRSGSSRRISSGCGSRKRNAVSASGAASSTSSSVSPLTHGCGGGATRDEWNPDRGDQPLPLSRVRRSPGLQR